MWTDDKKIKSISVSLKAGDNLIDMCVVRSVV